MSEEAIERLLAEFRRLHERIDALERRLAGIETAGAAPLGAAGAASWSASDEAREGTFGPRVRRSAPAAHRRAIERAQAMVGGGADNGAAAAGAETAPRDPGTLRTLQALQRIRAMQGGGAAPSAPEAPAIDLDGALPVDLERPAPPEPEPAPVEAPRPKRRRRARTTAAKGRRTRRSG